MYARILKVFFVGLILCFLVLNNSEANYKTQDFSFNVFRTIRTQIVMPYFPGAELLGLSVADMPSFKEGLKLFLDMVENLDLGIDDINSLGDILDELYQEGYLNDTQANNAAAMFEMANAYTSGIRRDQVTIGEEFNQIFSILRFSEIKSLVGKLKLALDEYYSNNEIDLREKQQVMDNLDKVGQMAALWVSGPISTKPMLEALRGGKTGIMAVNAQITASIPGNMLEAKKQDAAIMFEYAMSESNLEGGYTGQYAKDCVDAVRYYAFLLGFDNYYGIHADHTTVSNDTYEAVDYALRHNQAQLRAAEHYKDKAGFTSIAEDPSSLVAVSENSQLAVLNNMSLADFMSVPQIGEVIAQRLISHGEFKELKELTQIEDLNEVRINNLLDYIESEILVEILNNMSYEDLKTIPRISDKLADMIVKKRELLGVFDSLNQVNSIEGMDDIVEIKGIKEDRTVFEYFKAYLDLKRVIVLNHLLSLSIPDDLGRENEVGHIGRADPFTGAAFMTTPLEAVVLLEGLRREFYPELIEEMEKHGIDLELARPIYPDLLAINNGTVHGNVYVDGKLVPTSVNIQRTKEVADVIRPLGTEIAQHGVTGTPFDTLKNYLAGFILKANVGTQWRNIVLQQMPEDLFKDMLEWTILNKGKPSNFNGVSLETTVSNMKKLTKEEILNDEIYAPFISKNIKYSIKVFKEQLDSLGEEKLLRIINTTQAVSAQYLDAFNATGSMWSIVESLGWNWHRP